MDTFPHTKHRRHSISCILPPYILIEISKNGTPQQRTQALETLSLDDSLRQFRATAAAVVGPRRALPVISVKVPSKQRTIYDAKHLQQLPGRVARTEGTRSSADVSVNEAYNGL